jgi:Sulfatase-modifying factor enzyme 1/Domain of unknown function (DUF4388)
MQHKDGSEGFSGKLHNFALLDIIQMGCVARRDGRLRIRHRRKNGEVVLAGGKIVHAATRQRVGEAALLEVLCWTDGDFEFASLEPGQQLPHTISGGWEQVLMDSVRQRDEQEFRETEGKKSPAPPSKDLLAELRTAIAKQNQRRRVVRLVRRTLLVSLLAFLLGGVIWALASGSSWTGILSPIPPPLRCGVAGFEKKIRRLFGTSRDWRKQIPTEILIPAGPFVYQGEQAVDLPAFNLDSTEVTVWQYQEFLDAVGNDARYDHPNQRVGKRHSNPSWQAYARAAFGFEELRGVKLNPNFPAVYLDWFDAYAFAKWKHRRLPSELEWEKAGRGTDARSYPWGINFIPGAANLHGTMSGLTSWSEVGHFKLDCSPYGVRDLAGNVSEWTASDDGTGSPIVRGGNFMTEDGRLTRRILGLSPYTIDERIGFRTAGD